MNRERVAKLLRMLTSDNDQEAVSAARLIGKDQLMLLADWLEGGRVLVPVRPEPKPEPPRPVGDTLWQGEDKRDAMILLRWGQEMGQLATGGERNFVKSVLAKFEKLEPTRLTRPQHSWLIRILGQLARKANGTGPAKWDDLGAEA